MKTWLYMENLSEFALVDTDGVVHAQVSLGNAIRLSFYVQELFGEH